MSYNGYNYSPYYQPTGNEGRGQNSYQNSAGTDERYQASSYGSSNTHSAQQQQPTYAQRQQQFSYTPTSRAADRSTASYSRYGDSSGANQYQDVTGNYGYTAPSSAGTSALGNLAHASTLEQGSHNGIGTRDNRSLQQIIDSNRSQSRNANNVSPVYGSSASVSYGHQRSDSRGATSSGVSNTRDSPATDRRVSTSSQNTQYATTAGYSNPTAAYAETQENHVSSTAYQQRSPEQRQNAYYAQPARPPTGQSYHARGSDSQVNRQVNQSPTFPVTQAPTASTSYVSHGNPHLTYRPEQNPSSQQRPYAERRFSASPAQTTNNRSSLPTSGPSMSNGQQSNPPANDLPGNRQYSRTQVAPEDQAPKTVDPSHVFNHQEYQRRQAEAAAAKKAAEERARQAAEAEEARKATEAAAALKRVSESHSNGATALEVSKEDQMAAEMKQMIEKMRDYKSKDPSLFSQIWEQVKKSQPAGSVPAAPSLTAKDIPSTAAQQDQVHRVDEGFSPSPARGQAADGGLPDLGRFPAQRRRRGAKPDSPARGRKSKGTKTTDSSPQVNGSNSSAPADPAIFEASNRSQQPPRATTQQDGQNHQIVYVSGTGPGASQQVNTSNSPPISGLFSPQTPAPAPAPVVPPAQTPSTGKTAWPENKKWDLAVAAKDILLAMPVNGAKAKSISPEQILAYLNENPSYEKLCQMIESKGLIIERGYFARRLLEAVPGMGANVQRPALANRQPAAETGTPQHDGPGFGMSAPPNNLKYLDRNQYTVAASPSNVRKSVAPTAEMIPAPSRQPPSTSQPPSTKLEEKPTAPLTKQEMARKRNLLEIVDLSQLSDDDMPPPPKVQRLDDQPETLQPPALNGNLNPFCAMGQPISTQQPMSGPPAYHVPPPPSPYPQYPYPLLPPAQVSTPLTAPSLSASARQRELINSEEIVQPIEERKARKRKRYNPKTIVRDVLIAAGRHPTMQPLNYHLDGLRKTFKHVNDISDLSTLRWDLIDPGEPLPAPPPTPAAPLKTVEVQPEALTNGEGDVDGNDADDEGQAGPQNRAQIMASTGAEPSVAVISSMAAPRKLDLLAA